MTTIQQVIDYLQISTSLPESTVDKLITGNAHDTVTGIAVSFLATQKILHKAKDLGANLVISHEGIYYHHRDIINSLQHDAVYQTKRSVLNELQLAVYRYHDGIHRSQTDGIMAGLLQQLQWDRYEVKQNPAYSIIQIPEQTFRSCIGHVKQMLGIQHLRYEGDLSMPCKRIGVFVGYRGSAELALPLVYTENLDLMIYGEGPEWEIPEYIRDANYQQKQKGLIVLGHGESEMPGMNFLAQRLQRAFPDIPVHFLPEQPVLKWI